MLVKLILLMAILVGCCRTTPSKHELDASISVYAIRDLKHLECTPECDSVLEGRRLYLAVDDTISECVKNMDSSLIHNYVFARFDTSKTPLLFADLYTDKLFFYSDSVIWLPSDEFLGGDFHLHRLRRKR